MPRPVLRTELCEHLGIEYPVISAGMGPVAGTGDPVATADLAAAVSEAGGLGVIGAVAYSPDRLREEIRKVRSLTDKPFGVDLLLAPAFLIPRGKAPLPTAPPAEHIPEEHRKAIERIAAELDVAEITVKVHRAAMLRKMQARTVADLVRMAATLEREGP